MKTFRFLLVIASFITLVLASCEKDPVEERRKQDRMIIKNDLSALGRRVDVIPGGRLMPVVPVDQEGSLKGLKSGDVPSKYQIYLRAEVDPPVYKGKTLQASHIKIAGNYAFVTYNFRGPQYLGGVDVFDVTDIENPVLVQGVIFPEKDISSVDVDQVGTGNNNFIYLTGATNLDFDESGLESSAVAEKFTADKSNLFEYPGDIREYYDLPGFTGNDIRVHMDRIFVTSGSNGGLTVLNGSMQPEGYTPVPFARSLDTDGQSVVVYSAEENKLLVMNMDGTIRREITTGGEHFIDGSYLEAKSIVRLKDNLVFAATGTGGMEVYDINTGNKAGYLPRPVEFENADTPLNYVTNGVSVNGNMVLVANGGSGVHIAELDDQEGIRSIGKFMFEYGSSANFIEAMDNKIFVATGKGGLKILEIVELEQTEPCETLWDRIVELFPEYSSIHNPAHPAHDLSGEGLPGTIELLEDGPVYITFIHNGAGWRNSFGYYTYHKDNVPVSPDELEKNIIYPYVNRNSNHELRQQGERVRLGAGEKIFPAGTVIGFYIVAQGWDQDNNKMVEGLHTVYTTPEFNPGGVRKHVLFLEESCLNIVLGFEDMLGGSDEDFNDIIFTISNGDDMWGNEHNQYIDKEGLPVK